MMYSMMCAWRAACMANGHNLPHFYSVYFMPRLAPHLLAHPFLTPVYGGRSCAEQVWEYWELALGATYRALSGQRVL